MFLFKKHGLKKGKGKIKVIPRIMKRTRGSTINKQINQKDPDPWKEIRLKLQPLSKAFRDFREKRKIAKQKEERRRLKEQEAQRLQEEEAQRLIEQEEKKLTREKKLKAQEERKLKEEEERRLKEKKIKKISKRRTRKISSTYYST